MSGRFFSDFLISSTGSIVVSEASAGAVDFTCLDEKLIHVPSAAAKITSSAMLAVLRIRPS